MPYGVGGGEASLPCVQKGRWQVVQGGSGGCCAFGWSRTGEMSVIKGVKEVHKKDSGRSLEDTLPVFPSPVSNMGLGDVEVFKEPSWTT